MAADLHRLTVTGDSSAVVAASAWIRSLGNQLHLLPADVFRLDLCVSELVTNVASYGYTNGGDRGIELCAEAVADGSAIRVEVVDCGQEFDPLAAPAPEPATDVGAARIGGLGIHLVRSLADDCRYERADGRNIFTLVVKRSPAAAGEGAGELHGFISSCALFHNVPYRLLEDLLGNCPFRSCAEGEVLLRPGDHNRHIMVVVHGRLRVHLGSPDSPDYTEIGAGECAGEMSVIDGRPVSAYVISDEGTRVILIDAPTFLSRLLPIPEVARNLVSTLTNRMRRSNTRAIERMKSALELEALQRDLGFAREVQASMVPARMTLAPERHEIQCSGHMRAARQVGGDFYEAFYLDSNRVALVIGDVCGKGMPAALFMSRTMTLLRSEAVHPAPAAQRQHTRDFVTRANVQLCRGNSAGYFASVFAAILDVSTGVLTWINAGHPPPAVARGSSEFRYLEGPRNVLLGVDENAEFTGGETALPPGSVLLLYTDGLTEATDASGELFGEERVLVLLNDAESREVPVIIDATVDAVDAFAGGCAQSDDLTLLAVRYRGDR